MRIAAAVIPLAVAAGAGAPGLGYHFEEVSHKVLVIRGESEQRAAVGTVAAAGAIVRTGWFAHALVSVPERAARFELFSSAEVRLAEEQPGVLLVIKKGRLEAIFDALTGREDRLVAAPGALLAVRGTRYGLEVDRAGRSVLAVFEGTVEVRPLLEGATPVAVSAGRICRFAPGSAPHQEAMPRGLTEESWRRSGAGAAGWEREGFPGAAGAPRGPGQAGQRPSGGRGPH